MSFGSVFQVGFSPLFGGTKPAYTGPWYLAGRVDGPTMRAGRHDGESPTPPSVPAVPNAH